ncbi:sulfur transferase domain-containing protein [Paraferrimonas sp. SM1919]|uniref:fused DSP-PTPase phosphatase/NAD kinase-like protein n=1 Tax=Paraferrimonas sp. SM1919 TaxID=2662263 RepID=UPI0013D41A89|nr:protein tyrosine phosphatase family protein [Paraferrimonas sp. SM1919]
MKFFIKYSFILTILFSFKVLSVDLDMLNAVVHENVVSGGQPTKGDLTQLKQQGYKHVINLRSEGEQDWDEGQYVQSLGMNYHSLPIAGKDAINLENAKALNKLLAKMQDDKTIVHCGSGNRIGALVAIHAAKVEGLTVDEALAKGKAWGMTRLEPLVKQKLTEK